MPSARFLGLSPLLMSCVREYRLLRMTPLVFHPYWSSLSNSFSSWNSGSHKWSSMMSSGSCIEQYFRGRRGGRLIKIEVFLSRM